jgi:hypothetical protein
MNKWVRRLWTDLVDKWWLYLAIFAAPIAGAGILRLFGAF